MKFLFSGEVDLYLHILFKDPQIAMFEIFLLKNKKQIIIIYIKINSRFFIT